MGMKNHNKLENVDPLNVNIDKVIAPSPIVFVGHMDSKPRHRFHCQRPLRFETGKINPHLDV